MDPVRIEEYKVLRQELEMNRKFVFERPLLVVGATLAGALSPRIGLLTIPFLGVLLFNLWFTYNRLWSSARIVAYIQLVHEGISKEFEWIGWERALMKFRSTAFELDQEDGRVKGYYEQLLSSYHSIWIDFKEALKRFRSMPSHSDKAVGSEGNSNEIQDTYDPMGYYNKIFYFHVIFGVGVAILSCLLSTWRMDPAAAKTALPIWLLCADIAALVAFVGLVPLFWPAQVRLGIKQQRKVWKAALGPVPKVSPCQ
jgi:hypothetical protein